MKEEDACLFELLEEAIEKRKQRGVERLYNKFIEIIKEENPSPYYLLFILELIKWNIMKEIINKASTQR